MSHPKETVPGQASHRQFTSTGLPHYNTPSYNTDFNIELNRANTVIGFSTVFCKICGFICMSLHSAESVLDEQ